MAALLLEADRSADAAAPLQLNDRFRVIADGVQWVIQKRREGGTWEGIAYSQTRAGLMAYLGYEVFGVGEVDPDALTRLKTAFPAHRRFAPGYTGVDVEREIERARAQDRRDAEKWARGAGR